MPLLILITGTPAAGKTTLSHYLAQNLDIAHISKDGLKEILYDDLGWNDPTLAKNLGTASFNLLFYAIESHVAAHHSLLVDCPFIPRFHTEALLDLQRRYDFDVLQVVCTAASEVLFRRMQERLTDGKRHAGHLSGRLPTLEQVEAMIAEGRYGPLDLGGPVYEHNTTQPDQSDAESLLAEIARQLSA